MSYTVIYGVPATGPVRHIGEVHNSWRGGMAVWDIVAREYCGFDHFHIGSTSDDETVWAKWRDQALPIEHRTVLASTFDGVMVRRDHWPELIRCMRKFVRDYPDETNLREQAAVIAGAMAETDLVACCWNQTSVNSGVWSVRDQATEDEWREFDISRDANAVMSRGVRVGWLVLPGDYLTIVDVRYMLDPATDLPPPPA